MRDLFAAHKGYEHQDVVTAFALASIIFPQSTLTSVTADRKAPVPDDCFDDLELDGKVRRRIQIKNSQATELQLSDLKTNAMSFRLDRAMRSVVKDAVSAYICGSRLIVLSNPVPSPRCVIIVAEAHHRVSSIS